MKKINKYIIWTVSLVVIVWAITFGIYIFYKQKYFGKKDFKIEQSERVVNKMANGNTEVFEIASWKLITKILDESGNVINLETQEFSWQNTETSTWTINEAIDNETLWWIGSMKKKVWISQPQQPQPTKQETEAKQYLEKIKFIKNLQKKPFNIKWYYFAIIYWIWREAERWTETTDVIKIVVYNENTKDLVIFWLPRDRRIEYEWKEMKIDFLYHDILYKLKDPEKALEQTTNYISNLLDIPINYYVMIDFQAFEEFIDKIWWIDICTDKDLFWEWKQMLEKWCYTIYWDLALKISRTRKQDNDFFRMWRQNNVIYSIMEKVKSLWLMDTYDLAQIYIKRVKTNLNIPEIIYILNNFMDINTKVQVFLNNQCNFYKWRFNMEYCLFNQWRNYTLIPFVEPEVIQHYVKTMILYPQIHDCQFTGQWTYIQKLNLMNVWVDLNNKSFRQRKEFKIESLSGCDEKAINYFIKGYEN